MPEPGENEEGRRPSGGDDGEQGAEAARGKEAEERASERDMEELRQRKFWRWFASACLVVFALLALLLIVPGVFFNRGPLAQGGEAPNLDEAQAGRESIEAAAAFASTLGAAARAEGAESEELRRQGGDLTGQFLKEVGFPLTKDAARTIGRAIWNKYSGGLAPPPTTSGTTERTGATINLTIVFRDRQRPQIITKVIQVPDDG